MNRKNAGNKNIKEKQTWRIWDSLFLSSAVSVIKDSEDTRKDTKKFNHLLFSWLFAIVFTVILFVFLYWIVV